MLVATVLVLAGGCAGKSDTLIERINAYRTSPQMCAGKPPRAIGRKVFEIPIPPCDGWSVR